MQYTANALRNRSLRLKTIIKTKPGFKYSDHNLMLTKRWCKLTLLATLFALSQGCATHAQEGTQKALPQSDTQIEAAAPSPTPAATEQDAEQQAQLQEAQRLEQLKQAEEAERLAQIEQEQRLQQQEQARIEQEKARLAAQARQEAAQKRALEQQQLELEQQRQIAAQQQAELERQEALAEQEAQLLASQIEEDRLAEQQARQSRVDLAVQRLSTANYAFEPKREVEVGEVFEIKVVMQHEESPNSIQDYYPDAEVSIGQIKVDEYVEMKLKSQNSNALSIVAITQDKQPISKTISPIWRWSVTANEEGTNSLYLNITPIINLENPDGSLLSSNGESQTLRETITVVAPPFDFWQWLTTTTGIISAVIGTVFIGVLVNVLSGVVLGRVNKGD